MKRLIYLLLLTPFIISCEKEITLDLPKAEQKVVIEGFIEQDFPPIVFISKSAGYFDPVDSSSIDQLSVRNAIVVLSDGFRTDTLRIYDNRYPVYTHLSLGNPFLGKIGRTYTLKVIVDGKEYTASSKIHTPVPLDSLYFEEQKDGLGYVWGTLKEPPGLGGSYRWFAQRVGEDETYYPPFGSAFDDKFVDGTTFDFGYYRGMPPNSDRPEDLGDERGFFKVGDTVSVRFTTVDPAVYEFYRSYETEVGNNGNPFAAPGKVKTNIQGGALGIWAAYGASYDTLLIQ